MNGRTSRFVAPYAIAAAAISLVLAPLLSLAHFATAEGAESLEMGTVAAWAEPAREAVGVLVTFASPERVYATYTQLLALLMPALFLTAYAARARRPEVPRTLERRGWRTALTGYALFAVGTIAVGLLLIPGDTSAAVVDPVFMAVMVPGLLIALIGSTMLGIALLRSAYRPRSTAWLLTLSFPLWVVGSVVLGHNSIGLVPLLVAWAMAAWRWETDGIGTGIIDVRDATTRRELPLAGSSRVE